MSFLFGKKSKHQQQPPSSALPPATRNITSSHGPDQQPPAALNGASSRDADKSRGAPQGPSSTPSGSVNNSLSSLQASTPEQKALRDKTDPNAQVRLAALLLHWVHPCADYCRIQTPDS